MYYILLNELEKPKFDVHIDGALLNSKGQVQPNIFGYGNSVKNIADSNYSVKVNEINHYISFFDHVRKQFEETLIIALHCTALHCLTHLFLKKVVRPRDDKRDLVLSPPT